MEKTPKFNVGQTVLIDGNATGKGDLQGNIIEHSFNEMDGRHYYQISINGQSDVYATENYLSVPNVHPDTNTLENLQAILKTMKNEPKFKVGETVLIDGCATGKGDLEGKIIEHGFNDLDGKHYYLISIKGQSDVYVAEKFLCFPNVHPDTNTLENLYTNLKSMNEIAPIDRSEYFNNYMSEVKQRIKDIELLNEIMGNLPT